MDTYSPENWVVVKLHNSKTDTTIYKVFGSWRGGFTDGDSWRLNSGISSIEEEEHHYSVHGHSGSIYHCHKNMEGTKHMGMYNRGVLEQMLKRVPEHMEASIVPMTEVEIHA